jgi:hypothetical protein
MKTKINRYDILKIYKVFDTKDDIIESLEFCEIFFNQVLSKKPNYYDLNYGYKTWGTRTKYKSSIKQIKSEDINNLTIFELESESTFSFSKVISNPAEMTGYVEVIIASNKPFVECSPELLAFLEIALTNFGFIYGYGLFLDSNYDFVTERKIKKSIFGLSRSSKIKTEDLKWRQNIWNIENGIIKRIYPFNFLNKNQFTSPLVNSKVNSGVGEVTELNNEMFVWTLTEKEYSLVTTSLGY